MPDHPRRALRAHASHLTLWLWDRERRWLLYLAASLAALGTFLEIGEELLEDDELSALDARLLSAVAALRTPWLTIHAIDITALGSLTLLGLVMLVAAVPLARIRDFRGTLQLIASAAGAGLWTYLTKHSFSRARPDMVERLIEVGGHSFPSGHSSGASALYLTLAIVLGRHVHTLRGRALLLFGSCALALLIGLSRVYLGVHYPSDVLGGLAFGAGWALLVAAAFEWGRRAARGDREVRQGAGMGTR